jgi:hypothetical protein
MIVEKPIICHYCTNADWKDVTGHGRMEFRTCSIWQNRHRAGRVYEPQECVDYFSEAAGCRRAPMTEG